MEILPLKYKGASIVLQEVPDEISLAFNVSGCPVKCRGCHSKYLWEYNGELLSEDIDKWLNKYQEYVTCVCFMGGNQNLTELKDLCILCHKRGLKTCLYTGYALDKELQDFACSYLNYLKVGEYRDECGGLNKKTTNQRMYKIYDNKLIDITYVFQRKVD